MTALTIVLGVLLGLVAAYFLISTFICCELNKEQPHWWCPLCQLCKLAIQRSS